MKTHLLLLTILIPSFLFSQRMNVNLFGGFSNYQGDLQGKPFTLDQSNAAFGVGLSYHLTDHFLLRSGITAGTIEANDKLNKPSLQLRNLNFHTAITELNLLAEFDLFNLNRRKFSPYVFGGIAVYHFNPYTTDTLGNKLLLQPLGTEGQGLALYPDRKMYKLTQLAVPLGGGVKLRISDNVVVAYEVGLRKLFTDYLDDVSTSYADAAALAAAKGPKAVEMAYRGGEIKNGNPAYPPAGTVRGNPKLNDWYYFHGLTISIALNTGGYGRSRYGCPAWVL
jgi:hypothetical protein